MRSEIVWHGRSPLPSQGPRRDAAIAFDPLRGFSHDAGGTVYLTAHLDPATWNGHRQPIALEARAFRDVPDEISPVVLRDERRPEGSGRCEVHGPGRVAVGVPGLEADANYLFLLLAHYEN